MAGRQPGSRLLQDFEVRRLLGSGSFGTILECRNKLDKKSYAIKIAFRNATADAIKEIGNLSKVPNHDNLVQYFTCWKDQFSKYEADKYKAILGNLRIPYDQSCICIQMELCGQDLRKWLGAQRRVDGDKVVQIFIQLTQGIEHLHKNGLIHRDLKPDNVFLSGSDLTVKVGDLGIATDHQSYRSAAHTSKQGTPLYYAPEQESSRYGKAVDIYALGLILLELLCPALQPGVNGGKIEVLYSAVQELKFKRRVPNSVWSAYPMASKLILKMTRFAPTERPNFGEIYGTFATTSSNSGGSRSRNLAQAAATVKAANTAFRHRPQTAPAAAKPTANLPVHKGVNCDGCGARDIRGDRYKCSVCSDYDLCESCEKRPGIHSASHKMYKIKVPRARRDLTDFAAAFGNLAVTEPSRPMYQAKPTPFLTPHPNYYNPLAPKQGFYPAAPMPQTYYTTADDDDYDDSDNDDDDDYGFYDPWQQTQRNIDWDYGTGARCDECDNLVRKWFHCEDCVNFDLCHHCYDLCEHTKEHQFTKYKIRY